MAFPADEVAGHQLVGGGDLGADVLFAGRAGDVQARLAVGVLGQAAAVEADARRGAAPHVRDAELGQGRADGLRRGLVRGHDRAAAGQVDGHAGARLGWDRDREALLRGYGATAASPAATTVATAATALVVGGRRLVVALRTGRSRRAAGVELVDHAGQLG